MTCSLLFRACLACLLCNTALAAPGYYRDPALHGDTVVFTAEGDLWSVNVAGGQARRLTTHPAEESQAAISPDGRTLAFVASYDGSPEVYTMPLAGGEPQRRSHDGGRVWVQPFAPGGELVYASENVVGPTLRRVLRMLDPDSGSRRELPLADAREAAFDAANNTLWFTRFGLAVSTDNALDYRGGAMAQLWRWKLDSHEEAERVAPDLDANLEHPMWWQDRLVAVSDADGRPNLWSMAVDGSARRALTAHRDFDVRDPDLDAGRVVYQHGADLRLLDLASGEDRLIPITLGSDFGQRRLRFVQKPMTWLASANLSADGKRVALTARGHGLIAGSDARRRVEITPPVGARLRHAVLSHDARRVFALIDQQGRSEVWSFPADGSPGGTALTGDGKVHRWRVAPSPDGRWLAHDDKRGRLHLLDLQRGGDRIVDESLHGDDDNYADLAWSADGRYLALTRPDSSRRVEQLLLIEAASGRKQILSSDRYETFSPAFSPDGHWLYFLSNRTFEAIPGHPWGDRNTGSTFDKRTRVYAYALQSGQRFPFLPLDELRGAAADAPDSLARNTQSATAKKSVAPAPAVEFDGLGGRLFEVPLAAGNYRSLAVHAERLYLLERDAGRNARGTLKLLKISADAPKPEDFMAEVQSFALSADGTRLLLAKAGADDDTAAAEMYLLDASDKAPADLKPARVRVDDWTLELDPAEEWRQMFDDAWRMHREFSFDPGMRGSDWNAVRARFEPLLERVNDRAELDDLLAQMMSEHGILHSQVRGAELRADAAAPVASALGAVLASTPDGVRIQHIYRTDPELPGERGPLQQPGVDARNGDLIRAVNAQPVRSVGELATRLLQQAGRQTLLTLKRDSAAEHRTVVVPVKLDRDAQLRYGDWVQGTREKVEAAGDGRIGYLHLRAMGAADMAGFVRDFYAQYDRDALIIDVRRNRGGNIDSWVIEKLLRRAWAFWQPPRGAPYTNMQAAFRGHLAVLADQLTYSDGETFAAGVKALGLGPVIGMRTSGAGIWLSDRNRLADNGIARVAEFGQFDLQGRWLIEGRGVAPDIEVDNLPFATANGADAQLEAALAYLAERLKQLPIAPLKAGVIPARPAVGHDGSSD